MNILNRFYISLLNKKEETIKFIIIFYFIGLIGFICPLTYKFFVRLTTPSLILMALVIFYNNNHKLKSYVVFITIFILGLLIEIYGVNTGKIFGNYKYNNALGLKVMNTPIIIGLNWLILVYSSNSLTRILFNNIIIRIILSSIIMVVYDLILEQASSFMKMWEWENNIIPFKNYISWFMVSIIFNFLLEIFKVDTNNNIARVVFGVQFIFFLVLTFYINFYVKG